MPATFHVTFEADGDFAAQFQESEEIVFGSTFEYVIPGGSYPVYEGDYEVTPRLNNDIVLGTQGHLMRDDVTVKEIPVSRVSNPQDGITVLIG